MSEEDKPDGLDSLINSLSIREKWGFRAIVGVNGCRSFLPDSLSEEEWQRRSNEFHAGLPEYEAETEKAVELASESPLERG